MASGWAVVVIGMGIVAGGAPAAALAGAAAPRPDPAALAAALSHLPAGQRVRVAAGRETVMEGRFVAVRDGRLILDRPAGSIPVDAVETVWVRGRGTARGALSGGLIGGVGTGILFVLVGASICESDDCSDDSMTYGLWGAAIGGLGGSATGAAIGSALVHWRRLEPEKAHPGQAAAPPKPRVAPSAPDIASPAAPSSEALARDPIGSLSLHLGGDKAFDALAPSGGFGGRLRLSAELDGRVTPSLEIGRCGLGHRDFVSAGTRRGYHESFVYFGPSVTVDLTRGRVRPYALASVGYYTWNAFDPQTIGARSGRAVAAVSFLGGSLGGGVRLLGKGPFSFGAEGRWHSNLAHVPETMAGEAARRLGVLTLTAGATVAW